MVAQPAKKDLSTKDLRDAKDAKEDMASPYAVRKKRASSNFGRNADVLESESTGNEGDDTESSIDTVSRASDVPPSTAVEPLAVVVSWSGQSQEFSYTTQWQVRAVMANITTLLPVDKNMSLYHPAGHVFLEPHRDLQSYMDREDGPLALQLFSGKLPSSKEVKVKVGAIKKTITVYKATTALGVVMSVGEDPGFRPYRYVLLSSEKPLEPSTVVWKILNTDLSVVPASDLPSVNLKVNT